MKIFRALGLVAIALFTTATAAAATTAPLERHEHAPDVILQENADALGVDGWTVLAAIDIAAAAAPTMAELRERARNARDSYERGTGTPQATREAFTALRARGSEVVAEIEGLLNPAQREGLRKLILEARRPSARPDSV